MNNYNFSGVINFEMFAFNTEFINGRAVIILKQNLLYLQ